MHNNLKITALAGGVGGAKLADGISRCFPSSPVTIIGNTGDDLELFGLHISPDLDTVCYTLAGIENPSTGWGQVEETWHVFDALSKMEAPNWFRLGDKDLSWHMERTRLMKEGFSLTEVTRNLMHRLGVKDQVLPMSDQCVRTRVNTSDGRTLGFQEYFVKEHCLPAVKDFEFFGLDSAFAAPGVIEAINEADLIILCPSNPWVSIDPILSIRDIRPLLIKKRVVAVSPIIGGKTIKGPAAKMFSEMGYSASAVAVADHYRDFLSGFIMDTVDQADMKNLTTWGIISKATNIIMRSSADRKQLAEETIDFGLSLPLKG